MVKGINFCVDIFSQVEFLVDFAWRHIFVNRGNDEKFTEEIRKTS